MEELTRTKPQLSFVKLKDISEFQVLDSRGYKWKNWDGEKYVTSDTYEKGFQKKYSFVTDKGILEISTAQLGQMLEGVFEQGKSNVINKRFSVKTNGQTGKEIRYFINPVRDQQETDNFETYINQYS